MKAEERQQMKGKNLRRTVLLTALCALLAVSFAAFADNCAVCGGMGYQVLPVFGSNETVKVNCSACGGRGLDQPAETPAPEPSETAATAQSRYEGGLYLPDPRDFARGKDECVFTDDGYAVFECGADYDLDGYLAMLTGQMGYVISQSCEMEYGNVRFFKLTHPEYNGPLYLDDCCATVYYTVDGRISLATGMNGIPISGRASYTLPDPGPYAKGEDEQTSLRDSYTDFVCEEGYDIEGYVDLLRYEYGYDVNALFTSDDRHHTYYCMYNPDIEVDTYRVNKKDTRWNVDMQFYLDYYDRKGYSLTIREEEGGIIRLPNRTGGSIWAREKKELPDPPDISGSQRTRGNTKCSYKFKEQYDPERYVIQLIVEGFDIADIVTEDTLTTYYLFMPGYDIDRMHHDAAHMSVSYDTGTKTLTLSVANRLLELPSSGQPTTKPKSTATPNVGPGDCNICGGDGKCDKCGGDMWFEGYEWVYDSNGLPQSQLVRKLCQAMYCYGGSCDFCGGDGYK